MKNLFGKRCFIIAEAGVNHNGNLRLAKRLVDAAKSTGADAVKFQTFQAEKLVTKTAAKADYQKKTTGRAGSQYAMLRKLELTAKAHQALKKYCRAKHILFLSSPFDEESADLLSRLGVPAYKIGSGEITNLPFLEHVARKRKPVILSTGMSTLSEVKDAVKTLKKSGCRKIVLLQCVSNYPADPGDINLRAMETMRRAFHLPVGFSDHTKGIAVSLAAVALGASVIEKHLTLDCGMKGPDHAASLEPWEFKKLVDGVRTVEKAMGNGKKVPALSEKNTALAARKSLVAAKNIAKGCALTKEMIVIQRPGNGMKPASFKKILGKKTKKNIKAGALFAPGMLS